ncbi:MAG: hypothetical protein QOI78_4966 [Actinomycetota bacterium]|nr:hypothetical protein [Actinomycetota bacterium]
MREAGIHHPTEEGRRYCAAVMDACSRLVIGWSIADHMGTERGCPADHRAWQINPA